jgi:hypothetical protein
MFLCVHLFNFEARNVVILLASPKLFGSWPIYHGCLAFIFVVLAWCFIFPPHGGTINYREINKHLLWFLAKDWEKLQTKFVLWVVSRKICNDSFSNLNPFGWHLFSRHLSSFFPTSTMLTWMESCPRMCWGVCPCC